jgi:hypothetical protein
MVDTDVDYVAEGSFSAVQGQAVNLLGTVYEKRFESDPSLYLLHSQQISLATPTESLVLGGRGGDYISGLIGSLTGRLVAGRVYQAGGFGQLGGPIGTIPTGSGSGTFRFTLVAVPEPDTAALLSAGFLALALRRKHRA